MSVLFLDFSRAFPANDETENCYPHFAAAVGNAFGVRVPEELDEFWRVQGVGYFGRRELYFFKPVQTPRADLITWNREDFWASMMPSPREGGPVFFAENPFGEQLGFRWRGRKCEVILFIVDTMETFIVSEISELFAHVLTSRDAITDVERLDKVRETLGVQPPGSHYSPIVSPMIGGSGSPANFQVETPNVHFRTALATWVAVRDLPEDQRVGGVDLKWES